MVETSSVIAEPASHAPSDTTFTQLHRTMNSLAVLVLVAAAVLAGQSEAAGGSCPQPSKVYSCSPKCVQNYECSNGKVCCPNSCNAKSCVDVNGLGGDRDKGSSSSGGAGTYCNNVKCNSFEVCKLDPSTKRMKCTRA